MKIKTDITPGLWKAGKQAIGFSEADIIIAGNAQMHVTIGEKKYGWSTKESEANARLIASAPEMLGILVKIYFTNRCCSCRDEIKKLIEKITKKETSQIMKEMEGKP